MEKWLSREAHNLEIGGSNPPPATIRLPVCKANGTLMAGQAMTTNMINKKSNALSVAKRNRRANIKYFTYILLCQNNRYYVGHTSNLSERFDRHFKKTGSRFTFQNKPIKIVWQQEFRSETEAIKREKQVKGWSRLKKKS